MTEGSWPYRYLLPILVVLVLTDLPLEEGVIEKLLHLVHLVLRCHADADTRGFSSEHSIEVLLP
jgi:hypothetical protein